MFGCRIVTAVGALISGTSVIAAAFAPTLGTFILCFSVFGGECV